MRNTEKSLDEKPAALLHLAKQLEMKHMCVLSRLQGIQKVFDCPDCFTLKKVTKSQTFVQRLLAVTVSKDVMMG